MTVEQGRLARDEALDVVEAHAAPSFLDLAEQTLCLVALRQATCTTDDVWQALPTDVTTRDPRAMGAVMQRGWKNGWIRPTNETTTSSMARCHARRKMVWRSLIHQ